MAWIKLETHTFNKVEIYAIAESLGLDADSVIGKCCRVWSWFDANTTDGVTKSVTKALLDRQCGVIGFCDAMILAGWMADDGINLMLPYYDRHNSSTAKSRALGTKRQSRFKSNAQGNAQGNDDALPKSSRRGEERREDKRREDKVKNIAPQAASAAPKYSPIDDLLAHEVDTQIAKDWLAVRKAKKAAPTKTAISGVLREIEKSGMTADAGLRLCCERGWAGFNTDWLSGTQSRASPSYQTANDKAKTLADRLTGKTNEQHRHNFIDVN